jgi:N4-gp56 family major capsid protein
MSITEILTSDPITKKLWNEKLFREASKESYFDKFMNADPNSIVYLKDDFMKSKGDAVTYALTPLLNGNWVASGGTLKGNEENLRFFDYTQILDSERTAVAYRADMTEQRPAFELVDEIVRSVKIVAAQRIDELLFDALSTDPTRVFYLDSGSLIQTTTTEATAISALDANASKIDPKLISAAKAFAKTGGRRQEFPIRPVMIEGQPHYVLLVHPEVTNDLKQNATYSQANREARERSLTNPLFSNAIGVWDGVVVHESEFVETAEDGGAGSVSYAKCFLLGAQALCWSWGRDGMEMIMDKDDYNERIGIGAKLTRAVGKPKFDGKDYGAIGFYVSRTKIG